MLHPKGKAEPACHRSYYGVSASRFLNHHIRLFHAHQSIFFVFNSPPSYIPWRLILHWRCQYAICGMAVFVINTARSEQRQDHYHSDSSIPSGSLIVLKALGFLACQRCFFSSDQYAKRRSLPAQALTTSKHLYKSNLALEVGTMSNTRIVAGPDTHLRQEDQ